jgi:ParB family chromosome partitioning protein
MPKPNHKPKGETAIPANHIAVNEYRNLPMLVESATNPRRRFNEKNLRVAGARRLRAAKLAALDFVPVRVVALTDAQAIEAQVVENLQREDIHPLEEALGFRALSRWRTRSVPAPR